MAGETSALLAMLGQNDFNQFAQSATQGNIFSQLAPGILGTQFNTSTWSPATSAGVNFAKSLLGGLANNYGRSQVADQVAQITPLLSQLQTNPLSVQNPGVDENAFNTLKNTAVADNLLAQKAAALTKQSTADDLIKSIFAQKGAASPTAVNKLASESSVFKDLSSEDLNIGNGKNARENANALKLSQNLGGTISAIAALNDNEQKINGLEGDDSLVGLAQRAAAKLTPSSNVYNYQKGLPFLADPLTVGLSGSSRQGTLNKTIEALTPGVGQTKESMLDINNQAKQAMIDKAAKLLDTLKALEYPVGKLQDLQDKLDSATSGELIDNSYIQKRQELAKAFDSVAKPTAASNTIVGPDGKTYKFID